jgi:acetylornithine deacetylase
VFQNIGIPTVICGPGGISEAHRPNEYVTLEQLAQCETFMGRMLETGFPGS